jgi:hypothetical protein
VLCAACVKPEDEVVEELMVLTAGSAFLQIYRVTMFLPAPTGG